jgi:hypothetical protein
MIDPDAEIAAGYGTIEVTRKDGTRASGLCLDSSTAGVTLEVGRAAPLVIPRSEIASETRPVSGMPPMGLGLPPRALRDVIAYVLTLE